MSITALPGFYFDPEKNRYFRLLPGHNNCNPLTREMLQAKEQERRRSALLLEDEHPRKVSSRGSEVAMAGIITFISWVPEVA